MPPAILQAWSSIASLTVCLESSSSIGRSRCGPSRRSGVFTCEPRCLMNSCLSVQRLSDMGPLSSWVLIGRSLVTDQSQKCAETVNEPINEQTICLSVCPCSVCVCVCACMCVCACVCACMHVCVRACVCVRVFHVWAISTLTGKWWQTYGQNFNCTSEKYRLRLKVLPLTE